MKDIYVSILDHNILENFSKSPPDFTGKYLGSGASGSVYDYGDDKVIKIQSLRYPLNKIKENNIIEDDLYQITSENIILISDSGIIECLIMQKLANIIIPMVYDFGIYYNEDEYCEYIIMDKIIGISYYDFLESYPIGENRDIYIKLWIRLFEDMKSIYSRYKFVHGDLTRSNIFVDEAINCVKLIDFGRSSIEVEGKFIIMKHVFEQTKKHIPREGNDICKILFRNNFYSDDFNSLLDTCVSREWKQRRFPGYIPNVVIDSSPRLTYDLAIIELRNLI